MWFLRNSLHVQRKWNGNKSYRFIGNLVHEHPDHISIPCSSSRRSKANNNGCLDLNCCSYLDKKQMVDYEELEYGGTTIRTNQSKIINKHIILEWKFSKIYRRGSNGFQMCHWLSNILDSFLEVEILIKNLFCLQAILQKMILTFSKSSVTLNKKKISGN